MKMHKIVVALSLLSLASLSACVTPGRRTVIAGAGGAAIGAGVGGAVGDDKGALIGAGVGAAAGAALGNYLDRRAQELEEVARTRKTEKGLLVSLQSDVLFAFDSAQLGADAQGRVAKLGDILAKYPNDRIVVEGHTDAIGSAGYNATLSQRRARAVAEVLRSRGVKDSQITAAGAGEAQPVASNADAAGRAQNRRVELEIAVAPPQKLARAR